MKREAAELIKFIREDIIECEYHHGCGKCDMLTDLTNAFEDSLSPTDKGEASLTAEEFLKEKYHTKNISGESVFSLQRHIEDMEDYAASLRKVEQSILMLSEDKATYECQRCGAIYEIHNSQYMGCCTAPFPQRTSGICGGAIQIKHLNKLT